MSSSAHSSAVYLDHAATTPMYPAAIEAMAEVFATVGNASSLHGSGRSARRRIEESRESVAAGLGARPSEVIFTSGGTESDNLAVKGIFWARRDADPRRTRILASAVEHHAVLDAVEWLVEHEGAQVTWLPVDERGAVPPEVVRAALEVHSEEAALVTVMWANNETGTINRIEDIAAIASAYDVPIHSDAVQAAAHLPIDFAASGLSALSVTGHKLGGPQGVGALLLGRQVSCVPLSHGGGHERDLRSGTQDTASIVALASAVRITTSEIHTRSGELIMLRDKLIDGVQGIAPDAVLNGPAGTGRLPGNAHFTFPGCEGDSLLMLLDVAGVECSTGSACTAGVASASHVLTAMGVDPVVARGSLRFSLGHTSTDRDVETLLSALPQVIERARAAGLAGAGASGTNGGNR
ncbi:cysteine desulfurase family protein [Rhodococcus spongiicola]|uniref:Cysteine desulfurase n=1 Tax=Rhodococcus spongiicola TaxID=2487352 RepID=A0A438B1A1_9NOCA|nr:cysteine desulfurase family protein [Rhodococcus spongiicola]RVW04697.1 cysteine desulfurase [Rhodococcus spongiicola]